MITMKHLMSCQVAGQEVLKFAHLEGPAGDKSPKAFRKFPAPGKIGSIEFAGRLTRLLRKRRL
jgi:hypothetical protein